MLGSSVENGILGILAILVVGSLILLHFLLLREYARQGKIQIQRIKDFEKLVNQEINRSHSLSNSEAQLEEIKEKTNQQLQVINLQIKAIDGLSSRPPFANQDIK